MSLLLRRLLSRFLALPVGGDDPDTSVQGGAGDAGDPGDPAGGDGDGTLDELIDLAADPDVPRETPEPEPAAVRTARERAERAERELEAERQSRRLIEQRLAPVPSQSRDPQYEAEEQRLAEARRRGMTEESIGWLQWQINTDRANRKTHADAQAALAEAREIADRTAFNNLSITKPTIHRKYAGRVEEKINEMRARGERIPPREAVLTYLVGQDALANAGKKSTTEPVKPSTTVDRGRMPQARTDVSGRITTRTDREKVRERLKNVPI